VVLFGGFALIHAGLMSSYPEQSPTANPTCMLIVNLLDNRIDRIKMIITLIVRSGQVIFIYIALLTM